MPAALRRLGGHQPVLLTLHLHVADMKLTSTDSRSCLEHAIAVCAAAHAKKLSAAAEQVCDELKLWLLAFHHVYSCDQLIVG